MTTMNLEEFYRSVGGDHKEALARIPDDTLISKFLFKFADDPTYNELEQARLVADIPCAFRAAHTLKGVAYNLGLTALGNAASVYTEALRNAEHFPDVSLAKAIDDAYRQVLSALAVLKQ